MNSLLDISLQWMCGEHHNELLYFLDESYRVGAKIQRVKVVDSYFFAFNQLMQKLKCNSLSNFNNDS